MPSSTDQERRLRRRGGDELRHAVIARRHELGHDSLMHAASRRPFERLRIDALDARALLTRQRQHLVDPFVAAAADLQPPDAIGAQRLEHGIDAEDDHGIKRWPSRTSARVPCSR